MRIRRLLPLLLLLALVLGGCAPEPKTILYRDRELPVAEGVPAMRREEADFTAADGGTVTCPGAVNGVDVSSYQQEVDWEAVKADGVDFAIIRAGYRGYGSDGTLHEDSCFRRNLEGALAAGLDVGVYFFSQALTAEEAAQEAAFTLVLLEPYRDRLTYPVFFDWEPITAAEARTDSADLTQLTDWAEAFCSRIEEGGFSAGVYFNRDQGYLTYDISRIARYTLWLAEPGAFPTFYYDVRIWQYSHSGAVAGIPGTVDRNLYFPEDAAP